MTHRTGAEALVRDLSFHPSETADPKTLTPEQVRHYNEKGYVKGFAIFDEQRTLANRAYFDRLLDEAAEAGLNSYSINGYHARCAGIYDLVKTPAILDHVQDILGPDFVCWGTHYFCKMPHDAKSVSWHQDASYWPLTPAHTVTVWLAIDDADHENGCMRVIPGTHVLGHLNFADSKPEENNVLYQTVVDAEQYGQPADIDLKAGRISMHSDMLVHGSEPNHSDRRRCGLTMRYASTAVKPLMENWGKNAIMCRGEDRYGHWRFIDRPEGDHVTA